jgi:uncharacterized protein
VNKLEKLKRVISSTDSAVIAFSGGVDSTFLARVAKDVLNKLLLVTATSSTYPERELKGAIELSKGMELPHKIIISEELNIPGFTRNPPDRCYHCKKELFLKIKQIAFEEKYESVFDGSNTDDLGDYRPGRKALAELGIISPLCEAGMTKEDIRKYSQRYGLSTASKATFACLASRFPYGEEITKEKLSRVGKAEEVLYKMGFRQFRVRSHENVARIEVVKEEMDAAWSRRQELAKICKDAGFTFVTLDLDGYRTGAMNEVLTL